MTVCALTLWRAPPRIPLIFFLRLVAFCLRFRFRLARLAPRWCLLAPPVRGVLRLVADTRNPFFQEKCIFYNKPDFSHVLGGLGQFPVADLGSYRNFISRRLERNPHIWGSGRTYPQVDNRLTLNKASIWD